MQPNRLRRIGPTDAPPQWTGRWRTRRSLLRQVVQKHAVLNAGGSCPSRHEGRVTDNPPGIAMEFPRHASRPAPQGTAGAFPPVVGWLTWPASGGEPEPPSCGDTEPAVAPFGVVRPKASLVRCESWRWRGCASGFRTATPPPDGQPRHRRGVEEDQRGRAGLPVRDPRRSFVPDNGLCPADRRRRRHARPDLVAQQATGGVTASAAPRPLWRGNCLGFLTIILLNFEQFQSSIANQSC